MSVGQAATATLVSARAPQALDQALAARDASILVCVFLGGGVGRGYPERLDMATGETDSQERFGGVDRLREQVRSQREGAEVLEHGGGGTSESIGIIGSDPSYQLQSQSWAYAKVLTVDVEVKVESIL